MDKKLKLATLAALGLVAGEIGALQTTCVPPTSNQGDEAANLPDFTEQGQSMAVRTDYNDCPHRPGSEYFTSDSRESEVLKMSQKRMDVIG